MGKIVPRLTVKHSILLRDAGVDLGKLDGDTSPMMVLLERERLIVALRALNVAGVDDFSGDDLTVAEKEFEEEVARFFGPRQGALWVKMVAEVSRAIESQTQKASEALTKMADQAVAMPLRPSAPTESGV